MYKLFYGLDEPPFNLTPDSKFLYLSHRHQEALAALIFGIQERKGFICLSGEIGSGKTTLIRAVLAQFDGGNVKSAIVLNSYLTDLELLQTINEEFGLEADSESKKALLDRLNRFLVEQFELDHNCVLIIDEAQNLRPETLEQIRMISNLETETDKLIQIILVGQPELRRTLALPELEQLNQRITVRYHVNPLEESEIGAYIAHRLRIAGAQVNVEFTPQALRLIYHVTDGVPRKINVLCDRCLLVGYVSGRYDIDGDMVQQAIDDIKGEESVTSGGGEAAQPKTKKSGWKRTLQVCAVAALFAVIVSGGLWAGTILKSFSPAPEGVSSGTAAAVASGSSGAATRAGRLTETKPAAATRSLDDFDGTGSDRPREALAPAPVPTRAMTALVLRPSWEFDHDSIVRVDRTDHAGAASYLTLLRAWQIQADLSTFAAAPPEEVARYDMAAMVRQLDFLATTPANLSDVLRLDLPALVRFIPGTQDFSPFCTLLRVRDDVFFLADPISGMRAVRREDLEPHIETLTVLYRDPSRLTALEPGAAGSAVEELQRLLAEAGFEVDEVDGKFGTSVKDALNSFQQANGLTPVGRINPMTAAFLSTYGAADRPRLES